MEDEGPKKLYIEALLDSETIDQFIACKEAEAPLCLETTLSAIFPSKEGIEAIGAKGGFEPKPIASSRDVWERFLRHLSSLENILGRDAVAVIEAKALEEIGLMHCTRCPIYKMEMERKKKFYSETLPIFSEFLQQFNGEHQEENS